jgi:hypothetical protein
MRKRPREEAEAGADDGEGSAEQPVVPPVPESAAASAPPVAGGLGEDAAAGGSQEDAAAGGAEGGVAPGGDKGEMPGGKIARGGLDDEDGIGFAEEDELWL